MASLNLLKQITQQGKRRLDAGQMQACLHTNRAIVFCVSKTSLILKID